MMVQFPVASITRPVTRQSSPRVLRTLEYLFINLLCSLFIANSSYWVIEIPVMQGRGQAMRLCRKYVPQLDEDPTLRCERPSSQLRTLRFLQHHLGNPPPPAPPSPTSWVVWAPRPSHHPPHPPCGAIYHCTVSSGSICSWASWYPNQSSSFAIKEREIILFRMEGIKHFLLSLQKRKK